MDQERAGKVEAESEMSHESTKGHETESGAGSGVAQVVPGSFRPGRRPFAALRVTGGWLRVTVGWVRRLPARMVDRVMLWIVKRSGIAAKFVEVENLQATELAGLIDLTQRMQRLELHLGLRRQSKIIVPQRSRPE